MHNMLTCRRGRWGEEEEEEKEGGEVGWIREGQVKLRKAAESLGARKMDFRDIMK